jgi:hypothetical protein
MVFVVIAVAAFVRKVVGTAPVSLSAISHVEALLSLVDQRRRSVPCAMKQLLYRRRYTPIPLCKLVDLCLEHSP